MKQADKELLYGAGWIVGLWNLGNWADAEGKARVADPNPSAPILYLGGNFMKLAAAGMAILLVGDVVQRLR